MNSHKTASINQSGIYLFSNNREVAISLNDFLLVTFHSPSSSSTSVLLQGATEHRADFLGKLDSLFEKYSSLPDVDANLIQTKIFGSGNRFAALLPSLKQWLTRAKIPVAASNLSPSLPKEILLDARNGKIGLQYAPRQEEKQVNLLSTGTARDRESNPSTQVKVTILSLGSVTRTLAKQCIEEEASWQALCPELRDEKSLEIFLSSEPSSFIIFSDEMKSKMKFIETVLKHQKKNPKINFGWIGAHIPDEMIALFPNMKLFPPLEPFLLSHFKKMIKATLQDSLFSATNSTLPFGTSRNKSRSR